ncbi:MAG: DHH family phosphoesterase [Candidatus Pacearchaeota archaeon]
MLTKKEVQEIKEHLSKAQNPLFLFDNDQDGLCSFLLLRKYIGRGKGVPIKSFPDLSKDYLSKASEFNSDYIFILDKPVVSEKFFEEAEKINIPIVWIDHHEIDKNLVPSFVNYYNPIFNKPKKEEPVTALCYQISGRKEDMWIAVAGCISDKFVPDFYENFEKKYPDLVVKSKDPLDIFYKSQIGKIARMIGFGLKDRTTNVMNMIRFLIDAKNPYDALEENTKNHTMHERFKVIDLKFQKIFDKAISIGRENKKFIFFKYGGDMSMSGDLSNKLSYFFPKKIIAVIYVKGIKGNISMRGKKCRNVLVKAIEGIEGARGGGHEDAVGGQIKAKDIERFKENIESILKSSKR